MKNFQPIALEELKGFLSENKGGRVVVLPRGEEVNYLTSSFAFPSTGVVASLSVEEYVKGEMDYYKECEVADEFTIFVAVPNYA